MPPAPTLFAQGIVAPVWTVDCWFNAPHAPTVVGLRGRVIVIEAFQMLCPACVSHGLPQATRVYDTFDSTDVAVVGLHTVFEHHESMGPAALKAFLHEYRIRFPVAVDAPGGASTVPMTMAAYALEGTPTTLLVDRSGHIRAKHFGAVSDIQLGAEIATLAYKPEVPVVG